MNKNVRSSPALLLVLCFYGTGVTPAHACSCGGPTSACEAFWGTPVVFLGTALDVHMKWSGFGDDKHSYVEEHRSALFEVEEAFKGIRESERVVEVGTGMGGGDCGYDFESGKRYLVFAERDPDDGRLWTGICSVTHPVEEGEEDLRFLRSLPTAPLEGWVFGFVTSYWSPMRDPGSKFMSGIEIQLESNKRIYQATTDAEGNYRIDHLPAGIYKCRTILPGDEESPRTGEVKVMEKGCVELFFLYEVESPEEALSKESGEERD